MINEFGAIEQKLQIVIGEISEEWSCQLSVMYVYFPTVIFHRRITSFQINDFSQNRIVPRRRS